MSWCPCLQCIFFFILAFFLFSRFRISRHAHYHFLFPSVHIFLSLLLMSVPTDNRVFEVRPVILTLMIAYPFCRGYYQEENTLKFVLFFLRGGFSFLSFYQFPRHFLFFFLIDPICLEPAWKRVPLTRTKFSKFLTISDGWLSLGPKEARSQTVKTKQDGVRDIRFRIGRVESIYFLIFYCTVSFYFCRCYRFNKEEKNDMKYRKMYIFMQLATPHYFKCINIK